MASRYWIAAFLLCLGGCNTVGGIEDAGTDGAIKQVFQADRELVKKAAISAVEGEGLAVKETREVGRGFEVLFTKGMSAFSWGEVGKVVVGEETAAGVPAFVVSEKRYKPQITGTKQARFAESIFARMAQTINK